MLVMSYSEVGNITVPQCSGDESFNSYVIISKYLHFFFMFIVVYEVYFSLGVCIIDSPSSPFWLECIAKGRILSYVYIVNRIADLFE